MSIENVEIETSKLKDNEEELKFVFTAIEDASHYSNVFTKDNFKILEKWGLVQNMDLIKFRFNLTLDLKDLDKFLKDLFNDKNIRQNFKPIENTFALLDNKNRIENFKFKKISTKATNLDIFNVLYENDIVTGENGYIQKDFEDYYEEILICDKLKQALLMEESEYYCVFNEEIRNEFLFHIFNRLVTGGSLCQYEDHVSEYLDMTKAFYKGESSLIFILLLDIVAAAKDPNTKEVYIRSIVLQITNVENSNLYKTPNHPQNFFYVIIDPYQRHVHLWYHKWVYFW